MRKTFVDLCRAELQQNSESHVLLGDISVGGFIDTGDNLVPRVHNMGILEQAIIGFGAGIAQINTSGNIIAHTISPFLIERAFEQIKLCCGYNQSKLILISANGPYDYEKLGPTHHSASDVNVLSTIPNVDIRLPSTVQDFKDCFDFALKNHRTTYIRMTSRYVPTPEQVEQIDSDYRRVFLNGATADNTSKQTKTAVCIGETLKFVMETEKSPCVVYWTSNPRSRIPEIAWGNTDITVYEPYTMPLITAPAISVRKLFKVEHKKIIHKNLGWEDFE